MLKNMIYRHLRKSYPDRPKMWAYMMSRHYAILCEQKMKDRDYERYSKYKLNGIDWMFYRMCLGRVKK